MLGASADYAKAEKSRFWEQDTRPAGSDRRDLTVGPRGSNNAITARTRTPK